MLRWSPLLVLTLLAGPSVAAALGWWTSWGAEQQQLALRALLTGTLALEDGVFASGVLGTWEIPTFLAALAVAVASTALWERRLPPWLRLHAVPEAALALAGLGAAAAGVAVCVSVDRVLSLAVLAAGAVALATRRPVEELAPWIDPRNRAWRIGLAVGAASALIYGAASLLEGATFKNPAFRLTEAWVTGPGASPWTSGGAWLLASAVGVAPVARAAWAAPRRPLRLAAIGLAAAASALAAPTADLAIAAGLSGLGVAALVVGWLPRLQPGLPPAQRTLDPRVLARLLAPSVVLASVVGLRGLTVLLGTAPTALPPGVERISGARCVFGLQVDSPRDALWYTNRCAVQLGRIDAAGERIWDLREHGAHQVEELGRPDADGRLSTAVVAWTEEAQLVLLSIDPDAGPARAEGASGSGPDRPYIPLPSCWASAWIDAGDRVLLGCENTGDSPLLDPAERALLGTLPLGTRIEDGRIDGDRLYGVALWDDPRVRAWSWPDGEPLAERRVGPFNWGVERTDQPDVLWVSRFVEGSLLALDPNDLSVQRQVRLSFGLRALMHEPVRNELWAAAAYSGRLWRLDPTDPARKQALALCGQARALASDDSGRVYVATDCGVFRIDPSALPAL
jgi:hypothetical protein